MMEPSTCNAPPLPAKRMRPAIASASLMGSVDAVKPAVSTTAPLPTAMPAGLTSTRRPLELSVPKIEEGSGPRTRLIEVLVAEGWLNWVTLPSGTEKLCQLIAEWLLPAAFCVVTSRLAPWRTKLAWPATAWPPTGCARSGNGKVNAAATASAAAAGRKPASAGWYVGAPERGARVASLGI